MLLIRWITLRSLRTRPLRTLLSALGIVLGVAGLLSIQITSQTALTSLSALFEGTAGKTDLVVTSAGTGDNGLPERSLRQIERNQHVQTAVPSLQLQTSLAVAVPEGALPLTLLGFDMGGFTVYGIDPLADVAVRDYTLVQGDFLSPNRDAWEIVLVAPYAEENDLRVGETVELMTLDGPQTFEIVGLIAKSGAGQTNNGSFGVIPLPVAQELFHRVGELDQVEIVLRPGLTSGEALDSVRANLQAYLGDEYAITSAAAQGRRVSQMLGGFTIGLNFMGGMALFVGAYLIYNAFSMTIVERTREFGLLRTLGFTRGQLTAHVLIEAAILGVVGSLIGALLGIGLARGAARLLVYLLGLDSVAIEVTPEAVISSLAIGVLVTCAAALIPAWQAGRISPLEALRVRGKQREGWFLRQGWKLGLVMLLISAAILVANPFPYDVQFRLGSVTVILLFFGGTLFIPGQCGDLGTGYPASCAPALWRGRPVGQQQHSAGQAAHNANRGCDDGRDFDDRHHRRHDRVLPW